MFLRFGFGKGGVGVGGGYKDKESKAWEPKFCKVPAVITPKPLNGF